MAAPSGYKTFAAGEVLDASAGVMAYLMDQVVGVYANSSARATAIGTAAEGQVSYLKDTNVVYLYNGSAWVAVGGVAFSGSTANGMLTYSSASTIATQSTATYASNTLTLTGAGGGVKLDDLDSSDANTLDWYEEGLWTAALTATTSGSITINSGFDSCAYIRIGRMVFIQGTIELSSVSSPVGTLRLSGLPFVQAADLTDRADRGGGTNVAVTELSTATSDGIYSHGQVGVDYFDINGGNGGTAYQVLAGYVDASTKFIVSGSYYAAA
tara:strand:- start:174 stop:980 length:807 start_codon:yes stop_codon:yes gene_type:complete